MSAALITQSNYIPWKGYFDSINVVDIMVIYDDMQYTKRDWRNRNIIKTPQGNKWLSIPVEVKGKFFQKINETLIADPSWNKSHLDILKQNYRAAACYNEVKDWIETLYANCNFKYLSEVNEYFIREINKYLGITTKIVRSEEFVLAEDRNERLVNICKELGVSKYYSGPAAKSYMDEAMFSESAIEVEYLDYSGYREYDQLFPPFEHGVTILDLIFNCGKDSKKYLKTFI
jgi:hypothetical protein